jgi:proteasome lid subunit RPN8/RPN11
MLRGIIVAFMLTITSAALGIIQAHARSAYPEECCGILVGRPGKGIEDALPAQNLAPSNRATRYNLDPRAILHAEKDAQSRGLEIVGFYHSHPDHGAIPSATDATLAWETYCYLILPITAEGPALPRVWRFVESHPEEIPLSIADL